MATLAMLKNGTLIGSNRARRGENEFCYRIII
jgi:hypothetical protein